jgi:G3E family GTPase
MPKRLPVAAFSESLGSGNTTLLHHILGNREGLRVAVVVNKMSEVNIGRPAGRGRRPQRRLALSATDEYLVRIGDGRICCALGEHT